MHNISIEDRRHTRRLYKSVQGIVEAIAHEYEMNEPEATTAFYHSRLYGLLSDEETKVWWFSVSALFDIYKTEKETGAIENSPYVAGLVG